MAAAGTGLLAGLINPGYLIFAFSQTGSGQANACEVAVAEAMAMRGTRDEKVDITPRSTRTLFNFAWVYPLEATPGTINIPCLFYIKPKP